MSQMPSSHSGIAKVAHITVAAAKRYGVLDPSKTCQRCKRQTKIHGHHNDYSKPLEILWLCPKCHQAVHKELGFGMAGRPRKHEKPRAIESFYKSPKLDTDYDFEKLDLLEYALIKGHKLSAIGRSVYCFRRRTGRVLKFHKTKFGTLVIRIK